MGKIYDLFVVPQNYNKSTINEFIKTAEKLDLNGLCFCFEIKDLIEAKKIKEILYSFKTKKKPKINILFGIIINEIHKNKLYQKINLFRNIADLLIAKATSPEIQRSICEAKKIDLLIRNYAINLELQKYGYFDVAMTNLCKKNNIANIIIFSDLIVLYRQKRSNYLKFIKADLKLFRKKKAPIIVASGAKTFFELRDKYSLLSIINIFERDDEFRDRICKTTKEIAELTL